MQIELNFLPFESTDFELTLYRRKFNGEKREDGFFTGKLPPEKGSDEDYIYYWVSLNNFDEAEEYTFCAKENPTLMCSIIWHLFKEKVVADYKGDFEVIDGFNKFISFVVESFPEGTRNIKVSPYYLASDNKYGFILDFAFRRSPKTPFGKKVQELSFSIDKSGKSNANSYIDKMGIMKKFIEEILPSLSELQIGDFNYFVLSDFVSLKSEELKDREYIFANNQIDTDKTRGIKNKPYLMPGKQPYYIFIFKENEKEAGNELFKALIGKTYSSTFSGMQSMFGCEMSTSSVTSINIDLDKESEDILTDKLKEIVDINSDKKVIGIFIDSYSDINEKSLNYIKVKHAFFNLNIPLQAVRKKRVLASDGLKWAASGIGLQILSKTGGIPWLVKPSTADCLIFGIGTAHDREKAQDGRWNIKKYFAYSVCFDSTGLYKSLGVLGESANTKNYLESLKNNIVTFVKSKIDSGEIISNVVIHTPCRMRRDELQSIRTAIDDLGTEYKTINFVVLKINTYNKFFGFAENNLKIPYESTFVKLSNRDYLIWFEGLKHGKEYVNKRIANPTHIEIIYRSEKLNILSLLQDTVNLAGASWRGFNAKLEPISIFYPQLIARFIKDFRKLYADENYDKQLSDFDVPWFL
ncbi:MAG: Piwi domain-containing protein [Candidatus Gastranaerophilales bacterium]|nr:Piwi domain-containing protein [Candidatus Gastranaerophilales bacterium]